MMGPQWLCDCNESGGAETVAAAAKAAGGHFLSHGLGESSTSVGVYKERGDWLWSITTVEEAEKNAHPMLQVGPALTGLTEDAKAAQVYFEAFTTAMTSGGYSSQPFTLPRTYEQISFREAQNTVSYMYTEAVRKTQGIDWGKSRGLVSGT